MYFIMGVVNSSLMGLGRNAKFFSLTSSVCGMVYLWLLLRVHFSEVRTATNDGFIYYNVERSSYQIASLFLKEIKFLNQIRDLCHYYSCR
jgi:hypothetical protein